MPWFEPARILRASTIRAGEFRARGVPAIMLGVAGIVLAASVGRVAREIVPQLPETMRELAALAAERRRQLKP